MLNDFKEFAIKGNVVDMAVGIIIGAAFSTIVQSLVKDIIMPPIGLLLGGVDFSNFFIVLKEGAAAPAPYATMKAANEASAVIMSYGAFINTVISFLIVSFAIFILIRYINKLKSTDETTKAPPTIKKCSYCISDIPVEATRCPHCTSELSKT